LDAETGVGLNSDEAIINKARWRRLRAMVETGETRELGPGGGTDKPVVVCWWWWQTGNAWKLCMMARTYNNVVS
jgi:hypothetical protein